MSTPRCPFCKVGTKVEAVYHIGGAAYPDAYCGQCGKNWPKPKLPREQAPLQAHADDE